MFFTWYVNDRETFAEDAPNVRWVIAHGAGVSHLMPLDWLGPGAVLTNSSGVHGERAAEYAIMAVLMLNNRIPEMARNQARARWDQLYNTEVAGKTLLIVGVGSVGSLAARHAKHFGLHVIGVRRSGKKRPYVDEMVTPDKLRKVLPRADFLLMCAPDTDASHHMIAAPELDLMKRAPASSTTAAPASSTMARSGKNSKKGNSPPFSTSSIPSPYPNPRCFGRRPTFDHAALVVGRLGTLYAEDPRPCLREHAPLPGRQETEERG